MADLTILEKQQRCQVCPKRRNHFCNQHGDEVRRLVKQRSTCAGWGNVKQPTDHTGELAVIACYFNPSGYESIKANYFKFRENLRGADLFTIELSFDGEFVIPDALHITGSESNIMWQKERLLNILVETLPDRYKSIAWVDADVIFLDLSWAEQTKEKLRELSVIQLFKSVELTDSRGKVVETHPGEVFQKQKRPSANMYKSGYAWAARREVFPLYDLNIIGGGDSFMMHAWLGSTFRPRVSEAHKAAFEGWAFKQRQEVEGRIGYLPITIRHLWHGTKANRRYNERALYLTDNQFDPQTDIQIDSNGLWEWCSDKPDMHRKCKHYFDLRNDDGLTPSRTGQYSPISNLAIIACHFNPCGYRAPIANCKRFLEEIGHPVTLLELSFDGTFEFENSIRIDGNESNVMWQKERLINIGIQSLPPDVDAVAWIDADLLFLNANWYEDTKRLLELHQVVQLFQHLEYLGPDQTVIRSVHSWAEKNRLGLRDYAPGGGALAARLDAIPNGIYDKDILGSSDTQFIASLIPDNTWIERQFASMKQPSADFAAWKREQLTLMTSDVGVVPGKIQHLWHGARENRGYDSRIDILKDNDFNRSDITIDSNGLWCWNSDKPNLHSDVKAYFSNRLEDALE